MNTTAVSVGPLFSFALRGDLLHGGANLLLIGQVVVLDWLKVRVQFVHQRDTCHGAEKR